MLDSNRAKRCLYLAVHVKVNLVHETVYALSRENCFHFREYRLNRICLWAVASIEDGRDFELLVPRLHRVGFVHVEPIHKQRNWALSVLLSELFQVDDEVIGVNGLVVDR